MSISVTCPHCDNDFSVPEKYEGKRGKCPSCGGVFNAVSNAEAAKPTFRRSQAAATVKVKSVATQAATIEDNDFQIAEPTAVPSFVEPTTSTKGSGNNRRKKKNSSTPLPVWTWILLGVFVVAAIGGGIYLAVRGDGDNKVASKNDSSENKEKEKTKNKKTNEPKKVDPKSTPTKKKGPVSHTGPKYYRDHVLLGVVKIFTYTKNGVATGTGFFINDKGWIATNHHVIDGALAVEVMLSSGSRIKVKGYLKEDKIRDLAVIELVQKPNNFRVLDLFPSQGVIPVPATSYAVGHPLGNDFTVSRGTIGKVLNPSGLTGEALRFLLMHMKKHPRDPEYAVTWIRTDTLIRPGNSGGPLFNENWEVIGINTWINQKSGYGYASHIRHMKKLADDIEKSNTTVTPYPREPPEWKPGLFGLEEPQMLSRNGKVRPPPSVPPKKEGLTDNDKDDKDKKPESKEPSGIVKNAIKDLPNVFAEIENMKWEVSAKVDHMLYRRFGGILTYVGLQSTLDDKTKTMHQDIVKKMSDVGWKIKDIKRINEYSVENWKSIHVPGKGFKPGHGTFFFMVAESLQTKKFPAAKILGTTIPAGKTLLLGRVMETNQLVGIMVNATVTETEIPQHSKWLVAGMVAPYRVSTSGKDIPVVISKTLSSVTPQ